MRISSNHFDMLSVTKNTKLLLRVDVSDGRIFATTPAGSSKVGELELYDGRSLPNEFRLLVEKVKEYA